MNDGWWLAVLLANALAGLLAAWALWQARAAREAAEAARDEAQALADQLQPWLQAQPQQRAQDQAQAERRQQALRSELHEGARATRQELASQLTLMQQTLLAQSGDVARTQNEQIDSFRTQLAATQQALTQTLQALGGQLVQQAQAARDAQDAGLRQQAGAQAESLQRFSQQQGEALQRFSQQSAESLQGLGGQLGERLHQLAEGNERRLAELRQGVAQQLQALAQGNEAQLEQMRRTVDEKLHATLETRLGQSFAQVAQRLEQVHRGLGEMQVLARDVGSLNRVLSNVKTRGILGEVQLAGLLEQVLAPGQYAANVETVPGSGARVEFAIRLPGRGGGAGAAGADDGGLWLPIDAKFPREDHERLLEAQDRADAVAVEAAARAIELRLKAEARSIREKYLAAPHTTDFGILFLPTESLYAEALRRPGLVEALQREHRVTLAGPTTLLALLNSLQMGFRTLALERRSAEVWEVLGAVKTEFGKFGEVLAKTRKKLEEAGNTIGLAETRTRQMQRRLQGVEALPEARAQQLLPLAGPGEGVDDEAAPPAAGAAA